MYVGVKWIRYALCILKGRLHKSSYVLVHVSVLQKRSLLGYTRDRNVLSMWFLAGNHGNHQNFDPSLLNNKLWLVFIGMKQKNQNGRHKKQRFSKWPNLNMYFFWKFHELVLGFSRIDWCKGHWCSLTYMAVRLFDISSKTG